MGVLMQFLVGHLFVCYLVSALPHYHSCAQGAVAVEGEAHIWRPGRKGGSSTNVDAEADESHAFTHKDSAAASQGMLESASEIVKTVKQEIAAQEEVAAQGMLYTSCTTRHACEAQMVTCDAVHMCSIMLASSLSHSKGETWLQ